MDNSGSLSVEEFMILPELQQNPLVQRVIDIFDTDGNGEVDFKGNYCDICEKYIVTVWLITWNLPAIHEKLTTGLQAIQNP